ncbi:transposase [Sinorhizobium meliloti]|nr:transposase [Sinorhizobium meliloti]MDE4589032.1 transposase [Sinorhizobium meliloti]
MDEARHDGAYRRIKVITGRRQRRNWTGEEKARILAESAEPDVNISAVARRWGVNRGLLYVWRGEAGLAARRSVQACAQGYVRAGDRRGRTDASAERLVGYRFRCFRSN